MHQEECAVVINVRTELVTTLALASAAATGLPVVLVNCEPSEFSRSYFRLLQDDVPFSVMEGPIRNHGATVDWLFSELTAERVLFLDSDAEICDQAIVEEMQGHLDGNANVFGAGWLTYDHWLDPPDSFTERVGRSLERPWMPCVMFQTKAVRSGLRAGHSFEANILYNEFRFSHRLSCFTARRFQDAFVPSTRLLDIAPASVRERLRTIRLDRLAWLRGEVGEVGGERPHYVFYDTGADIYQWCRYSQGLSYAMLEPRLARGVSHLHGVTRLALGGKTHVPSLSDVEEWVLQRLNDRGLDWLATSGAARARS